MLIPGDPFLSWRIKRQHAKAVKQLTKLHKQMDQLMSYLGPPDDTHYWFCIAYWSGAPATGMIECDQDNQLGAGRWRRAYHLHENCGWLDLELKERQLWRRSRTWRMERV